jgi:hypothetical protein
MKQVVKHPAAMHLIHEDSSCAQALSGCTVEIRGGMSNTLVGSSVGMLLQLSQCRLGIRQCYASYAVVMTTFLYAWAARTCPAVLTIAHFFVPLYCVYVARHFGVLVPGPLYVGTPHMDAITHHLATQSGLAECRHDVQVGPARPLLHCFLCQSVTVCQPCTCM